MGSRCLGWCGACYEGMKGRRFLKGHYGYRRGRPYTEESMGSVLRKRVADGAPPVPSGGAIVCPILAAVPGVREMLIESHFPDGTSRKTSTLLVFAEEGIVKLCLNDRAQGVSAWASGASIADALEAIERGLQGDTLQWRQSYQPKGGKRDKRS